MMYFKQLTVVIIVLLSSCGGGSSNNNPVSEDQSTVAYSYTVNFPDNSAIAASSQIILIFDKTLDPSKVVITGAMAGESDGGVWSANSSESDTLTITPASSWIGGSNKTLVIEIKDAAGSILQTISLNYTIDLTAPQVTNVSPVSASIIGGSQQIIITFDEPMDISSLSLSGPMQVKSDAGVWSSTGENINDKLTLTPTPSWDVGAGQILVVDVNDVVGNPLTSLNLGYTVDLSSPSVSSINVPNGTILLATQSIVIVFDRTMDAASLALGNNMAAKAGAGVWSNTNSVNDTLTIPPAVAWAVGYWVNNDGIAQQLSINARDSLGNSLPTLTLGYVVDVVSVSNAGDDANPGTLSLPMKNIGPALVKADSLGIKNVYVQAGSYSGTTDLVDGINIKGGFNNSWIYDSYSVNGHAVILDGASGGAFFVNNIATETRIENMVLTGSDASGVTLNAANSSYVVRVANSSNLILSDVKIISGNGADGADGNGGQDVGGSSSGYSGKPAQKLSAFCDDTTSVSGGLGGLGVLLASASSGGKGGKGGTIDTSCVDLFDASDGQPGENADGYAGGDKGKGGNPGQGDTSGICDLSLVGSAGFAGADGLNGTNGTASVSPSGDIVNALWLVSGDGGDGDIGTDGMGGGGGGGSGGCDDGFGTDIYGASGGGGGAGGAASTLPGSGGMAGGYSIGLLVLDSSITINNTEFVLGSGGTGGAGGAAGFGQLGGNGSTGGSWINSLLNGGVAGGRGGNGGKGGDSGTGAGGAGGSAYGILFRSSLVTVTNVSFSGGTAGAGGSAPNPGPNGSVEFNSQI